MSRVGYLFKLSLRLLWPRRSWMRIVTLVCVVGVALGSMLQIVVRGVMDGMVEEINAGVEASVPCLLVSSCRLTAEAVEELPEVSSCREVVMGQGLLNGESCRYATWGAMVKDTGYLIAGNLPTHSNEAMLSKVCAEMHGVQPGDDIVLCSQAGNFCTLRVCGVFRVPGRMLVPDLITPAALDGQKLLAIESKIPDEELLSRLRSSDSSATCVDGTGDTDGWLRMIAKVKRVMGIILYLVVLIAAFATGGMVLVICLNHRQTVAVMWAFGATPRQTFSLFLCSGALIAFLGSGLGLLQGYLVLQYRTQVQALLKACGLDAFPSQTLDMKLPALAPVSLYVMQGAVAWLLVMAASALGAWIASRFCRLR